jgi:hypothetical protein
LDSFRDGFVHGKTAEKEGTHMTATIGLGVVRGRRYVTAESRRIHMRPRRSCSMRRGGTIVIGWVEDI